MQPPAELWRLASPRQEVSGHTTSLGMWLLPGPAVLTAAALPSLGCCPAWEARDVGVVSPALVGGAERWGFSVVTHSGTSRGRGADLWAVELEYKVTMRTPGEGSPSQRAEVP